MFFKKRKGIALLLALMMMTLSACGLMPSRNASGGESYTQSYTEEEQSAQKEFDEFTEGIFKDSITEDMISLHYTLKDPAAFGITDYTPTLGTFTLEDMVSSYDETREALKTLQGFTKENLTRDQQITYDILESTLNTTLSSEGMDLFYSCLSPVSGVPVQLPVLFAEYEFNSERDVTDYLTILEEMDTYYAQIGDFEREKSAAGYFMSDYVADEVIKGCQDFINTGDENYLISVFDERLDAMTDIPEDSKAAYKERNLAAIRDHVIPAYENLIACLSELKGTSTNDKGIYYFENGTAYYDYLIKAKTGSSRSGDEIITLIEEYLNEDLAVMSRAIRKDSTIFDKVDGYTYPTYDPTEIIEDLKVKIQEDFPALPEASYTIKYVHPSLEESMSPAFYITPPIDDSNRNMIYINQNKLSDNSSSLYTTIAHEGYPGHLYQNVYFNQVDTCNLRRAMSFTGYSEGWASYVEFISYSYPDGMEEAVASFLSANGSATLALYAYMDISINYKGWNIDDTKQFLNDYFGEMEESVAKNIYYTMVADPVSYLKYYLGYVEIMELREKVEETMGEKFVLKDFHEQFLSIGPAQFDVIEKYIMEWAENAVK